MNRKLIAVGLSLALTASMTLPALAVEAMPISAKAGYDTAITLNGKELDIKGDTLCVHGDGPKALAFVQKIREVFAREGIEIRNFQ